MTELELLKRRLEREQRARKQAESILETKALELYQANLALHKLNESLENVVADRTRELEHSELRFRQIVESATDFIYEADGSGNITLVNPMVISSLGLSSEKDILGKRFIELVPEEYRKPTLVFHEKCIASQQASSTNIIPVRNEFSGELIWVEQSISYFYQEYGKLERLSAVARDVTKRVLSEKALQKTQLRLTSLISNLNAGILVEDEHRRIVLTNEKFTAIFGIPAKPADLAGYDCSNSAEESKHLFEDPAAFVSRIGEILSARQLVTHEELRMVNGTILRRDYIPIFENDNYTGHLWQYEDVTARKSQELLIRLSEEKYRGMMEGIELGLMEVDVDGKIVKAYKRFCEMTGYEEEELLGKQANEVFLPQEYIEVMKNQDRDRLKGKAGIYEIEIFKKGGERIWVIISGAPYYNERGAIQGSMGIHYDITGRKTLEKELIKARARAEKAMLVEKQFLANMSHEIRNPINAIVGVTNLLYDTSLDQEQLDYVKTLKFSTDILMGLISGILDLSKIESGLYELAEQRVDIRSLAAAVISTFEFNSGNRQIKFLTEVEPDVPAFIMADPTALNQILMNLVGNSVKFTEKGFVVIAVKNLAMSLSTVKIELSVWDTGIGIPKEKQEIVFESFKQADKETKLKYGGTGLGLSIVRQLVHIMNGSVLLESEEGQGTTFKVILEFQIGSNTVKSESSVALQSGLAIQRVLIVEDNVLNQEYLSALFRKWGIRFDVASNGEEALSFVEKHVYSFILMDIRMPKMDGYEATIRIRNSVSNANSTVPIIALTASALIDERNKALEVGMNYHLTKPFTPEQLYIVLSNKLMQEKEKKSVGFEFSTELDKEHLLMLYEDDVERAAIIFQIFVGGIDAEIDSMKNLLAERTETEFIRKVHKIAPNFSMVGLTAETEILVEIETEGKKAGLTEHLTEQFESLISQAAPRLVIVRKELERINNYLQS